MGMDLDLYVADESIDSPFLTRSFKDEIIFERYIKFANFLDEEALKIVRPNIYGEIVLGKKRKATFIEKAKIPFLLNKAMKGKTSVEEINKLRDKLVYRSTKIVDRERDPRKLKEALKKIEQHLSLNRDALPLVHFVYKTKALKDEMYSVIIDGVESHLKGDLFFYDNYSDLRNKIHIEQYSDDCEKISFYIDAKTEIQINNTVYFTKSISKSEQFEEEFIDCYHFLDEAIKKDKRVLWEIG